MQTERQSFSNLNNFDSIAIQIASPEQIKSWAKRTACHCSYPKNKTCTCGEVKKPETINYRTFRPERDGLFCEAIFGPTKDWECACGKYKRIKHKGIVCDRCGVEVTQVKVRRERMGYIQLAAPVSHIWFFKGLPSVIGLLLDLPFRDLERVLYFEAYIVLDPADSDLKLKELLTEEQYIEKKEQYPKLRAEMGAAAIKELLANIDLEAEAAALRAELGETGSKQKAKKLRKRLKLIMGFQKSGNKPGWMILDVIPVIPAELRPLVALDGGRFATSDLNDLYRRVINRNNRLKRLMELRAPDVIIRNEKRMLQEAVDALLDNGRHGRIVRGPGNRPLKSISDMLKGKSGRFRQNLLGKRVDYSGRSVIVVGPELRLDQCGLPKKMALELFKPFIIRKLQEKGYAATIKSAKKMVEKITPEVWEVLEEVISEHPVLLNRAPTLHRLGIQAFQPALIEGKAIRIHPLVCNAFNADFDGDQMAVHIPLSTEAQIEAKLLMMASQNILKPAHGDPIAVPELDMVLGCNYLTKERFNVKGEEMFFSSADEAIFAYQTDMLNLHAKIKYRLNGQERQEKQVINTTTGRVIFNQILPEGLTFYDDEVQAEIPFCNKELEAKDLHDLVAMVYEKCGNRTTVKFLDDLKRIGFEYATKSGISIAITDMLIPKEKQSLIKKAQKEVDEVENSYRKGLITSGERYNKVINIWSRLTGPSGDVEKALFESLRNDNSINGTPGFNPLFIMADSGARSKKEPIRQMAGIRGLMGKPSGEIIETPIFANFREGLSVLEYFISTHGARKGLADTAIKTASSGYLTRKLVDVAQDVIITEEDCGTLNGITKSSLRDSDFGEPFANRIISRTAVTNIRHPVTNKVIVATNELITKQKATEIENAGISEVKVRSVLTCNAIHGVCRKCYGTDLSSGKLINIGEAIGIIAAQSIGEPGTQLTMRTFHTGGAASALEQSQKESKNAGVVKYNNVRTVVRKDGKIVVLNRNGRISLRDEHGHEREQHKVPAGAILKVVDSESVQKGVVLLEWDPHNELILTEVSGKVKFQDIIEGVTMREVIESTGYATRVITETRETDKHARIEIVKPNGAVLARYDMPIGAHLPVHIHNGDTVSAGDVLAQIPRETSKTKDIVMGLPRVTDLFEARKPRERAYISEIDGYVKFEGASKGKGVIKVVNPNGTEKEYSIPMGKHVIVREGDWVEAGDPLTDGLLDPHDILFVKGENDVQAYLVNQIQEVYRMQGERINDKHIEVIIRQMLRKIRVENSGDTDFLVGDEVDKVILRRENKRVEERGGKPARVQPILQGITKAALSTESFISAASFQQTTNVLTRAAVYGKRDKLQGLKENVIMGHLIPAGTGVPKHRKIEVFEKGKQFGALPESKDKLDKES